MKKIKAISSERAYSIIHKPLMTEKSTNLNQFNQYSFVVAKSSNSNEIKLAIEKIFKVKVTKINKCTNVILLLLIPLKSMEFSWPNPRSR